MSTTRQAQTYIVAASNAAIATRGVGHAADVTMVPHTRDELQLVAVGANGHDWAAATASRGVLVAARATGILQNAGTRNKAHGVKEGF